MSCIYLKGGYWIKNHHHVSNKMFLDMKYVIRLGNNLSKSVLHIFWVWFLCKILLLIAKYFQIRQFHKILKWNAQLKYSSDGSAFEGKYFLSHKKKVKKPLFDK